MYMALVVRLCLNVPVLKLMSWTSILGQAVGITREAILSNFWGLACPIHCHPSSLAFLIGSSLGAALTFHISVWIFLSPSPQSHPPSVPSRVLAQNLRRRLEGYGPLLNERQQF